VVAKAGYCHLCGERLDLSHVRGSAWGDPDVDSSGPSSDAGSTHDARSAGERSQTDRRGDENSQQTTAQRFRDATGKGRDAEESDLWEGGYSAKAMMGSWILGDLLSVGFVVAGVWAWNKGWNGSFVWGTVLVALAALWMYLFGLFLYRRLGVRYRLSSQRFFHAKGIIRHTTDLIEVIDMDDITFEQSLIERLTGVGSIHIISSDRSHPDLTVAGIDNVKQVAAKLHDARHAERMRRGLHIEQI